jgi:uncharacterized damage-inducible protein DinB
MATTLRPQLDALRKQSDEVRAKAAGLQRLSAKQLQWSPKSDRWNILQILDHLNKTHALCLSKFDEALAHAPEAGDERDQEIRFGITDRVFLLFMRGDAPIKAPVPPIFEPDASPDAKKTLRRFIEFHDAVARVIDKSDDRRLKGLKITSPVSDKFRPGYLAYLTGLVLHEAYHWGQVEALLADPDFPKARETTGSSA